MKSRYFPVFFAFVLCFAALTCAVAQNAVSERKEWPATATERMVIQTLNQRSEILQREQAALAKDVQAVISDARARLGLKAEDTPIDYDVAKGVFFAREAPHADPPAPVTTRTNGVAPVKGSP